MCHSVLDRLCRKLGAPRAQLVPGPVCKRCFQDLERLTKVQSLLRARFTGYLREAELLLRQHHHGAWWPAFPERMEACSGREVRLMLALLLVPVPPVAVHLRRNGHCLFESEQGVVGPGSHSRSEYPSRKAPKCQLIESNAYSCFNIFFSPLGHCCNAAI